MLTYNLKEIEEDIIAFEGVEIVLDKDLLNGDHFIGLYSEWAEEPFNNDCCVDDLKNKISQFLSEHLVPKTSTPIPSAFAFVLCAGHPNSVLDIITATNDENEIKAAVSKSFSIDSSYTALCLLIGGNVQYFERQIKH